MHIHSTLIFIMGFIQGSSLQREHSSEGKTHSEYRGNRQGRNLIGVSGQDGRNWRRLPEERLGFTGGCVHNPGGATGRETAGGEKSRGDAAQERQRP